MDLGASRQAAVLEVEVEVADPVANIAAAADGKNDLTTRLVESYVASDAGPEPIETTENSRTIGLNSGTVAAAGNRSSSRQANIAVGGTSVLGIEGKVVDLSVTNGFFSRLAEDSRHDGSTYA